MSDRPDTSMGQIPQRHLSLWLSLSLSHSHTHTHTHTHRHTHTHYIQSTYRRPQSKLRPYVGQTVRDHAAFPSTAPRQTKSDGDNDGGGVHSNTYIHSHTLCGMSLWLLSEHSVRLERVILRSGKESRCNHEFDSLSMPMGVKFDSISFLGFFFGATVHRRKACPCSLRFFVYGFYK